MHGGTLSGRRASRHRPPKKHMPQHARRWPFYKFPEIPMEICEPEKSVISGNFPGNFPGNLRAVEKKSRKCPIYVTLWHTRAARGLHPTGRTSQDQPITTQQRGETTTEQRGEVTADPLRIAHCTTASAARTCDGRRRARVRYRRACEEKKKERNFPGNFPEICE